MNWCCRLLLKCGGGANVGLDRISHLRKQTRIIFLNSYTKSVLSFFIPRQPANWCYGASMAKARAIDRLIKRSKWELNKDKELIIFRAPEAQLTRCLERCAAFFQSSLSIILSMLIYHHPSSPSTIGQLIWNPKWTFGILCLKIKFWCIMWTPWCRLVYACSSDTW